MDEFENALLEIVPKYPCLYRDKDKKLQSLLNKNHCWIEIAEILNKTPQECKNKWRTLRDNYKKNQKRKNKGELCVSKYDDERLKFIDECSEEIDCSFDAESNNYEKGTVLFVNCSGSEPFLQDTVKAEPSSTPKIDQVIRPQLQIKRKRASLVEFGRRVERARLRRIATNISPVHTFFKSMADVVSQFPPDKIAQVRAQVCNIVTKMDLQVLAEREN